MAVKHLPPWHIDAVEGRPPHQNPAETPTFSAGASDEVSTIVPAGRWRVAADDSNGHHGQVDIELGAGGERTLDLRLE